MSKIEPMSISKKVKAEAAELLALADRHVHAPPKANSPAFANLLNKLRALYLLSHDSLPNGDSIPRATLNLLAAFREGVTNLKKGELSPHDISFLQKLTDDVCKILFANNEDKTRFLAAQEELPQPSEQVKAQLGAFVDKYRKPQFAAADGGNVGEVYRNGFTPPPQEGRGLGINDIPLYKNIQNILQYGELNFK